ncbi:MAG: MarR family transcriptional regulator [Pseudomonadota bacterium]
MTQKPADGLGTQLRRLLELLDGDVEAIYRQDHPFYTPRYTPVMKALSAGERLSIKDIAARSSISHSAASQTISRLVDHGLVELMADTDKRARIVTLTKKGKDLAPWLEERWRATARAADALDRELSHPLSQLLAEAIEALEKRPFATRIRDQEKSVSGDNE